jgi:ADP-ribosyl-[dinitrogen reductase] hydrolase
VPDDLEGDTLLVELAVGDAYGAGFEYGEPDFVAAHNTLAGYVQHPRHVHIRPGRYTDDTQMTLAIAELLLAGTDWTPQNLADKFVEARQGR